MNFLQRIFAGTKSAMVVGTQAGALSDTSFVAKMLRALDVGGRTYAGKAINDASAMQVSTVWSCVRILSETIGALPWAIYERDANGNSRKVDHDLGAVLIDAPNADMTSQEFREATVMNLALRGNGYSQVNRNGRGGVTSVYPMAATDVMPMRDGSGTIFYRHFDRGRHEDVPAEKVWHIKGFGSNGLVGLSPIGAAAQAMGLALTMEEYGARFFANGARVSGVIKAKDWLSDKQRPVAREIVERMHSGVENAHKMMLLEGGMDYTQMSVPPGEAQFLEARGLQVAEICRFYRIPPHMVADLRRATFSNIEQQSLEFVTFSLLPYLVRFEQTVARRLFSPADRKRFFLRFNFEGLLRADSGARASLYSVLLQNGVLSRNEARALENWSRSDADGMDDYTVQSNMANIDQLTALVAARSMPPKQGATQ